MSWALQMQSPSGTGFTGAARFGNPLAFSEAPGKRLLLVEDNARLAELMARTLADHAFSVEMTASGVEGEAKAQSDEYDAIILDLMLPDRDGVEVCRNLRRHGRSTPILMLTALSSTADKVTGLDAGADDYLPKPFELEELVARIKAVMRRVRGQQVAPLTYEDLSLDPASRQVSRAGKRIALTAREFALLEYFMRNPNRVLSRSQIGERVWDMNFEPRNNVIEVYISRLRNKIDRGFDKPLLHTVIKMGYILSADGPPG